MPTNRNARMPPIVTINVFNSILRTGSLKFVTALDIASTPVKDDAPDENAFNSKNSVTPGTAVHCCVHMWLAWPVATFHTPTTIIIVAIMNK